MTQTRAAAHRKHTHRNTKGVGRLLRGLGVSILTTLVGVALFSLLMQWVKPSDGVIRVFNQVLKLLSIALGVWSAVGRGVALNAILSGQQAACSSDLADLAMGVAGGGIVGMILSNISAK